jgi:inhibitor of cysteine peptidase
MRNLARLLVVVPAAVLSLRAFSTHVPGSRQFSENDSGSTVELRTGDTLAVMLSGNPTTGYQWEMASVDTNVLKQRGKPEYTSNSAAVGAGGKFIFAFEAAAPGQTVLRLVYRRPFEKNVPPASTFEITAVVK